MRFRSRARPEFAGSENKTEKADRIGPKTDRRPRASVIPKSLDDFGKIIHPGKNLEKIGTVDRDCIFNSLRILDLEFSVFVGVNHHAVPGLASNTTQSGNHGVSSG